MPVKIDSSGLKGSKWHEYAVRFLLGGLITLAVGFVAKREGPVIAGLFLAFPAIFPASATLVQSHEEERKQRAGLNGKQRGIDAAGADAMGAALGSCGLLLFAAVCWRFLPGHSAVLVLSSATLLWGAASGMIWWVWKRFRRNI
jgi:uncharacterized membrane protein (GlpM family)